MPVNRSSISLKAILPGGAAIPVELTERAREQGIRCFCGYGLTEFASTVCAREVDGLTDVDSSLPGWEARIANDEVRLRAASTAGSYWCNEQRVPLINDGGWYATRDRNEIHNGELAIAGRLDNLFFSGGEGIQPEEAERVIAAYPATLQVLIVPVADKEFGHWSIAVVEYDQQNVGLDEWVKDKLARFQQPVRRLTLSPELRSGGIKISHQALKEWVKRQQ